MSINHANPRTVTWAQRSSSSEADKNFIYLTISAPDVSPKSAKIDLKAESLSFSGYSDSKKANYVVNIEFFAPIDPEQSKIHHSARDIEMKLQKKDLNEEYWPRLFKEKVKQHWLKTDFDKVSFLLGDSARFGYDTLSLMEREQSCFFRSKAC